ncbi:uncharacterized protein LOC142335946 isoform X2 [Convolutriloba macropyga]|uniref:uncharacterized protein LOC142335946 isoform X2 n=1 Tax=Convolutriloba macropyga TaxID=536237 RepID=UPI003F51EB7F
MCWTLQLWFSVKPLCERPSHHVLCERDSLPSRKTLEPTKDQIWKMIITQVLDASTHQITILAQFLQLYNPDLCDEQLNNGSYSDSKERNLYFDNLAPSYKRTTMLEKSGAISYDSFLHKIVGFSNPKSAYTVLTNRTLLNFPGETKFNGVSLWGELGPLCSTLSRSPQLSSNPGSSVVVESAETLRKNQNIARAMKSVGKGVQCFKEDRHVEAMQHFNIALEVEPQCVEGLVARGALHTKLEVYTSAISDFKEALSLKPTHKNANKYLLETYLSYAKREKVRENFIKSEKLYREALDQFNETSPEAVQLINTLMESLEQQKEQLMEREARRAEKLEQGSQETALSDMNTTSGDTSVTAKQIQKWLNKEKQNLKKKKKKEREKNERKSSKDDRRDLDRTEEKSKSKTSKREKSDSDSPRKLLRTNSENSDIGIKEEISSADASRDEKPINTTFSSQSRSQPNVASETSSKTTTNQVTSSPLALTTHNSPEIKVISVGKRTNSRSTSKSNDRKNGPGVPKKSSSGKTEERKNRPKSVSRTRRKKDQSLSRSRSRVRSRSGGKRDYESKEKLSEKFERSRVDNAKNSGARRRRSSSASKGDGGVKSPEVRMRTPNIERGNSGYGNSLSSGKKVQSNERRRSKSRTHSKSRSDGKINNKSSSKDRSGSPSNRADLNSKKRNGDTSKPVTNKISKNDREGCDSQSTNYKKETHIELNGGNANAESSDGSALITISSSSASNYDINFRKQTAQHNVSPGKELSDRQNSRNSKIVEYKSRKRTRSKSAHRKSSSYEKRRRSRSRNRSESSRSHDRDQSRSRSKCRGRKYSRKLSQRLRKSRSPQESHRQISRKREQGTETRRNRSNSRTKKSERNAKESKNVVSKISRSRSNSRKIMKRRSRSKSR